MPDSTCPNGTTPNGGREGLVTDWLAVQAAKSPDAIAVICGGTSLTYRVLFQRASALAARLRTRGVEADSRVALCAVRSADTIVGLLAILHAGAAYVPLDPDYPAELLEFMFTDSGARLALAPRAFSERMPVSAQTLHFEDEEAATAKLRTPSAGDLAYVIYTSGSTGRPKGVAVTHANLAHSTRARFACYENPPARFLLLPSFAFDSSVAGIFWTLCSGGTLILPESGQERDPAALAALIAAQRITHTLALPSLHALLLPSATDLSSLEAVIVAGETCPPSLPAQHARRLPKARLFNEYGPTEATVWSTVCALNAQAPVSIGRAIPGSTVHLLDAAGQPVADGASGEIHIGGGGVARGYWNQPELTAEKFLHDPWSNAPGARLYKTGDLARRLPGGNLEFLGRLDRQVKIRGHRVELDAIEAVLQSHPEVRSAAVLVRDDDPGEPCLVAYVAPAHCPLPALRHFLAKKLPAFMQPATVVTLDAFPLTPNGKVDRAALPAPNGTRPQLESAYTAPRTALEHWIEGEWRTALGLDRIGIHDKFFELGGDSLRAAQFAHRLQQKLGEPVFVVALFAAPTIAQLADLLKKNYAQAVARHFGEATATHHAAVTTATLARVRALLPTRRPTTAPPSGLRKNPRAIFILAPPRSGTTLLRAMLGNHPGLFTASELRLLGHDTLAERRAACSGSASIWRHGPIRALADIKGCDEAEAARIVEECEQENLSTSEFFALLQQTLAPRELVDKSPSYALDPGALRQAEEIFEDAFYIHLARHPYEMIRSFAERRMDQVYLPTSAELTPLQAGEAVWLLAHRNVLDFLGTVPAERQAHLHFSDLVSEPRAAMEKLCAALHIPFDPGLLDPYRIAPAAGTVGIHSFDDPRFREHATIDRAVGERWRGVLENNFLSDLSWELAAQLGYEKPAELRSAPPAPTPRVEEHEPIAIVGLAGRFPGAADIESFWENLCAGVESIRPFTPEELRRSGIDPAVVAQPGYVNAGAVPDDADRFAASFFGYTPRDAELMDPQQRLFLECAWEAFEHAGCDVARSPGTIGVYAGVALNSYFQNNLAPRPELAPLLGHYSLTIGNEKDFVATRVAHKLGLRGPAIGVQTACSSSLVAVHLASQSLRAGEIDLALVGGGRIRAPLHAGYTYVDGGIPSPDGHCRAFDADARGCVATSGLAVVVLKRLSDAQRDGDHIFAVIKASAINNDGGEKAGFTAPAVEGQAEVIARAHAAAGVTADTIGYVEAHGTGTSVGDPIEVAALTCAFRATSEKTGHCHLGSVKTNIGHLDAGAGVAGLIKTALALDRGVIPPSLHFTKPNPHIDFASSAFVVNATLTAWPRGAAPRRAGVSSFGIGGTNAHVVLEEAPPGQSSRTAAIGPQVIVLSAKTATALDQATANLAAHLRAHPDLPLADVAFTLQTGRRQFQHRRIVIASSIADAAEALEKCDPRRVFTTDAAAENPAVIFLFPGQGAQYAGTARELFENEPVFRDALQRCAGILRPHLDLLAALYPAEPASETITATAFAQPTIFAVEYALAKLWESWGIEPSAMLGHSVGEFTAACLAGVFTLEDALNLLAGRARLMQEVPGGSMLAVRLPEPELRPRLRADIELAAINSPRLCVVSGPRESIAGFAGEMAAAGIACAPLQTSHAFHSAMMEPVIAPFAALARRIPFHAPRRPLVSALTGGDGGDFAAPEYWTRQLREPVRFASAVASLPGDAVLLEVGPGNTLSALARQTRGGPVVSSLHASGERDQAAMLEALGRLWLAGVTITWDRLQAGERPLRVALPTYPFERERYWIEPPTFTPVAAPAREEVPAAFVATQPSLHNAIKAELHALSGVPIEKMSVTATFLELGFDSLFLTQAILAFRKRFGVTIAFRQLFEELSTIDSLAAFLAKRTPEIAVAASVPTSVAPAGESFGPFRPPERRDSTPLTSRQREHLDALNARYTARTAASKRLAQEHRAHFADPRSVSGFRPFWKELVYPLVVERSAGSKLWDIDGHEYVDFTMGYGTNLLGHSPRFITEALAAQLERGIEIGPQSPLAGEVARLLCEFSGLERAAFCNTGSEAVLAAVRVARTVTGRARIATCSGYHGINDEFLVRAKTIGGERRTVAIAPGIPDHVAREVLAVDYGAAESLEILRAHAHELAAVVVEPVQSRHPALQPREFLHELRRITRDAGVALVFDEMITGFRCHPGGAQAAFGVRADLVTYGKIIGGGMPIGALCGRSAYMDALDGGAWNFGDESRPETGVTFFAGTYVRHPLAMAGAHAVLTSLKREGAALQQRLNERTRLLVAELHSILAETSGLIRIESFGSMFLVKFADDFPFGGLLFFHLREKGIHAWDNRLLFLSTAHTEEDLARFTSAFRESVAEMRAGGFFEIPSRGLPLQRRAGQEAAHTSRSPLERQATVRIAERRALQFSLYFFGDYPAPSHADKYQLVIESTRFADEHGFTAVWLPERHFHSVGGFSPNAAVMAAALARETSRVQLRAGSVVLPLHHPIRVAEEWSLVDNLSRGRIGISIASGWHPNDFVFAPDAYENRRELCTESLATIRQLWRGDAITARNGSGQEIDVKLFPLPVQRELPVWLTCVQPESYARAGELGLNVLGQLQNQSLEDVAEKIRLYRAARERAGHDRGHVTMLLHTFVTDDDAGAHAQARGPLRAYLRSHVEISQRKLASRNGAVAVGHEDLDFLLDRAVNDYARGKAFIGTPESCAEVAEELSAIGVDEVGCLIDFGVDPRAVLANLPALERLKQLAGSARAAEPMTLPLTPAQRGLCLLTATHDEAARAYNEASALELRGPLDTNALRAALQAVVGRHEALRTSIDVQTGTQTVHPQVAIELPLIAVNSPEDLARCIAEVRTLRFDFSRAPLMDARLCRLGAEHHILLLTFHHVLGDGPSYIALFEDLCALYAAQRGGTAAHLAPALQLRDFLRLSSERSDTAAATFWQKQFADSVPTLELPLDRPRPAVVSFRGARETLRLDAGFVSALRDVGAQHGGTLFTVLLSAFQTLLLRLSGQNDVIVGVPFSDAVRTQPGGDRLFANATNVAPLRSRLTPETTFAGLLATNRQLVLAAHEHQHYFFGDLIAALGLPFEASRAPLFSVFFNYENGGYHREVDGLTLDLVTDREPFLELRDTASNDLYLNVAEQDGTLFFRCDYNRDLFDATTIQRWLGHLHTLLEAITANPRETVQRLPLLNAAERRQLLDASNRPRPEYPATTLHELFAQQVARTPDAIAVLCEDARVTYAELDTRATALAAHLCAAGVEAGVIVALCLERSTDLIVGLLAILKAGGAYLPIDPACPPDRLAFLLADSQASIVVTQSQIATILPAAAAQVISIDHLGAQPAPPLVLEATTDSLAYVIYTSGSTGQPKGCCVTHRNVARLFKGTDDWFHFGPDDVWTMFHSVAFDFSVWEIWGALLHGGRLVIVPHGVCRSPEAFRQLLVRERVTVLNQTPSAFRQLIAAEAVGEDLALRLIILGGEALEMRSLKPWFERHGDTHPQVVNMFGITETTVHAAYRPLTARDLDAGSVIGRPLPDLGIYLLDPNLDPVPIGIPGEIYVAGAGLARGYLNRPELTAQRFIDNPFQPGEQLYRTGDLARWRPDGDLEYLGRIDQQVKIRGYRVEPGEIQAALLQHPGVREAVVLPRHETDGETRLIGYLVPSGPAPTSDELRAHLKTRLPDYMVPSAFVVLEHLPLTQNGKLDRRALPEPDSARSTHKTEFVAPRNAAEERVAEVWRGVLKVASVGVHDDFFDLGGHSLAAMQVVSRLRGPHFPTLNVPHLFQHSTVAALVATLGADEAHEESAR